MFSFPLNNKGNCLQLWTLLGGNLTLFCWTEASSRELISHTCLALLRSQGVLACSLLVAAGTDVRGRKEETRERMRVFLLTPSSKKSSAEVDTNASDRVKQ